MGTTDTLEYARGALLPDPEMTLVSGVLFDATDADVVAVLIGEAKGAPRFQISATATSPDTVAWEWPDGFASIPVGTYRVAVRLTYGSRYREFAGSLVVKGTMR